MRGLHNHDLSAILLMFTLTCLYWDSGFRYKSIPSVVEEYTLTYLYLVHKVIILRPSYLTNLRPVEWMLWTFSSLLWR